MCMNRYSWPVRLFSLLTAISLAVCVVGYPRVKAVAVVDDVAVGAMSCEAFLASIGLPLTATGGSSAVTAGVTAAAGEYAAATGAAASGEAFLGTVAAGTAVSTMGAIVLTAAAAYALGNFAYWLYDTYLADSSSSQIYSSTSISDSSGFSFSTFIKPGADGFEPTGTCISYGSRINFDDGSYIALEDNGAGSKCALRFYNTTTNKGYITYSYRINEDTVLSTGVWLMIDGGTVYRGQYNTVNRYVCNSTGVPSTFFDSILVEESVSLVDSDFRPIPEEELGPTKQMVIDVGAAPGTTLDDLAQSVPDAIANGNFQPTYNIQVSPAPDPVPVPEPAPEVNPNPEVEAPEDIAPFTVGLGEVFPFCIPFDIYHMVTMFAAEPEAPAATWEFTLPWSGQECEVSWSLEEWDEVAKLCRSLELVLFCVGLAAATYKMIKW